MADGVLYIPEDFEKFRDLVRINYNSLFNEGKARSTPKFDTYNLKEGNVIVASHPYKGVLIFPSEKDNEGEIISELEKITKTKLFGAKSNGN